MGCCRLRASRHKLLVCSALLKGGNLFSIWCLGHLLAEHELFGVVSYLPLSICTLGGKCLPTQLDLVRLVFLLMLTLHWRLRRIKCH